MTRRLLPLSVCLVLLVCATHAQDNRIDIVAPHGAGTGGVRPARHRRPHDPGHRTKIGPTSSTPRRARRRSRYDRTLTLEVWYPASAGGGAEAGRRLPRHHARSRRDGHVARQGRARRRAASPLSQSARIRLSIISHGYPGNRFLLSHLAENLASKGYVDGIDRSQRQHLRRSEGVRAARSTTGRSISCSC